MRTPIDIKAMPGYNPEVTNGVDSVSRGLVYMNEWGFKGFENTEFGTIMRFHSSPYCKFHGAMLRVSKDGIYRCGELGCDTGCYCP